MMTETQYIYDFFHNNLQYAFYEKCNDEGVMTIFSDDYDIDLIKNEYKLYTIRQKRNKLLAESDWTQLPDSPLTETQKESWRIYRQELRDITGNSNYANIVFPEPPIV